MPNKIKSLAVGASLHQNKFSAVVLKFLLTNGSFLLASWSSVHAVKLLQIMAEYISYLSQKEIALNGDSAKSIIQKHAPKISQSELESAPPNCVVTEITGHVDAKNNITLTIGFDQVEERVPIVITPEYAEWIVGYVVNTLNEFDESGNILVPESSVH